MLGQFFDKSVARIYRYIAELEDAMAKLYGLLAKLPNAATVFPTLDKDIKTLTTSAQWFASI